MRRTRARAAWVAAPVPAGGSSVSIMVALQIICVSPPLLRCPQLHKAGFSMLLLAAADAGWLRWIPGGRGPTGTFSSLGRTAKLLLSTGHDRPGGGGRTSAGTLVFLSHGHASISAAIGRYLRACAYAEACPRCRSSRRSGVKVSTFPGGCKHPGASSHSKHKWCSSSLGLCFHSTKRSF